MTAAATAELLDRYDRPAPRYTSYPPIPYWSDGFGEADYRAALADLGATSDTVAVYVHLPFCVSRCFYCGCNATVTRHDPVRRAYVERIGRELDLVESALGRRLRATQIHWGGGTPNFLSQADIDTLAEMLQRHFEIPPEAELSIEADPRVASVEQLAQLARIGFRRLSFGIQDFDPEVQRAIGRIQPLELVRDLHAAARALPFHGVNYDLVYGLPEQTEEGFARTLDSVIELAPDRIACFGYAHVPWARPNQRRIDEAALPRRAERFGLFRLAVERLTAAGYRWIGLDHFALPDDDLVLALERGRLGRNFMGYIADPAAHLLALGTSGIGEVAGRYVQADPKLGGYSRAIDAGRLPIVRGHRLTADDCRRRSVIERLMTSLTITADELAPLFPGSDPFVAFEAFAEDQLVALDSDRLRVTPSGRFFLRNLCTVLDAYASPASGARFSPTV